MSAVLAALMVLALLVLLAGLYVRCRLSVLLWYRNRYGELEINGEKGVEDMVPPLGQASPGPGAQQCAKPPPQDRLPFSPWSLPPQMGSCMMPTCPTPPPRMTASSSTSS